MKYTKNPIWLDCSINLPPTFQGFLSTILDDLAKSQGRKLRSDQAKGLETALSVIIANLLRQRAVHPSLGLRIDLSNDGYPKGPYNPLAVGIRAVRSAFEYLHTHKPPLIHKMGGNFDRVNNITHPTQIWGLDQLFDRIFEYWNHHVGNINIRYIKPITRNTFNYEDYLSIYDGIIQKMDIPSIRLRSASSETHRRFIDFESTPETNNMMNAISEINNFIGREAVCNLFIPDKDFDRLRNEPHRVSGDFEGFESASVPLDLLSRRKLYRVFNDGTFKHGGRFYGGWWQNVPSDYRRFITINGLPTVEIDYSNMQPAMLYAKVGQQFVGDAYAVEGIDPSFRPLIKTTFMQLINGEERIRAPRKADLPENMTWEDLRQTVLERHKPIAQYFGSGEGKRLQRLDSDIAEMVMVEMMAKGILALPVHDSFIVAEGQQNSLRETMLSAYQQKMDGKIISLKQSPTLFDDLLDGQGELSSTARHDRGMALFQAKKEGTDYAGYRRREELLSGDFQNVRKANGSVNTGSVAAGPIAQIAILGRKIALKIGNRLWDRSMSR